MSNPKRVFNFNPGPAVLPLEVLEKAQAELLDFKGTGMSVMEISHRSKEFEAVIQTAEADLRELLGIPANYKILFLQGGASLQFAMLPMNLRAAGASADYIVTGTWSKTAIKEATETWHSTRGCQHRKGRLQLPARPTSISTRTPPICTSRPMKPSMAWNSSTEPTPPAGVPLVCDTSSDFISRPVDVSKYALIYAGAQKNAGPAGVTVVIARDDMIERTPANLPVMLDYKALAASGSLHNTPPAFAIYIVGLVFQWAKKLGGLAEVQKINRRKADAIYNAIDESGGFYRGHAAPEARSVMNIPFRLPTEELEDTFRQGSQEERSDRSQGTPLGRRHARFHLQRHELLKAPKHSFSS